MKNAKTMSRRFAILVVIAVSLIPALYNLIFLSSMWDPYGNIQNLPVAVVNQDVPATVSGKTLSLGDQITTSLKKQHSLDYDFVSSNQAKSGIADGTYYMVVTLPKELSKDAGTLLGDNPTTPTIHYDISEGRNFTASKMVSSAATALKSSVSQQVTKIYVSTLLTKFSQTGEAFSSAHDGAVKLQDGTVQIASGSDKISTNLLKLSTGAVKFSDGANTLTVGVKAYTQAVAQVNQGVGALSSGSLALSNGASQLTAKGSALVTGLSTLASSSSSGAKQLSAAVDSLNNGVKTLSSSMSIDDAQSQQMQQLVVGLPKLNEAIQQLNTGIQQIDVQGQADALSKAAALSGEIQKASESLSGSIDSIVAAQQSAAQNQVKATQVFKQLDAAQQEEILNAVNIGISQGSTIDTLKTQAQQLAGVSATLKQKLTEASSSASASISGIATLKQASGQISSQSQQALPGSSQAISKLSAGMAQAKQAIDAKLLPGTQQLGNGVSTYGTAISNGAGKLAQGAQSYVNGVGTLGSGIRTLGSGISTLSQGTGILSSKGSELVSGSQQLASASSTIAQGTQQLKTGEDSVGKAVSKVGSGLSTMSDKFSGASNAIAKVNTSSSAAKAVSAPVNLKQSEEAAVPNNGTAMAPYMMSVALFVGALAFNMMFAAGVPRYRPRSAWHWWVQKMPVFLMVSIAQATVVFGAVMLLGLQPLYPGRVLLLLIAEALAYMSLITMFNVLFGKVGAFLMLIFLMLQLAGSGGTYPVVLSNGFFKALNPWLPMTHAIDGLRQAISIGGGIGSQLFLFITLFTVTNIIMLAIFSIRRRNILANPSDAEATQNFGTPLPVGNATATGQA